jgi:hypothetical protein
MDPIFDSDLIFDPNWLTVCLDDTLPPDHVKLLGGGRAQVFRLDIAPETAQFVADWPEAP